MSAPGRWTRWVAWVQERETGETLAFLRIALGLAVIGTISTVVAHDLVPFLWLDAASGGYREVAGHGFLYGIIGVTPTTVWGGVALGLLSGLFVTLGLGGRLPAFLALKAIQELTDLNGSAGGSYDALLTNALWLLVLGDLGSWLCSSESRIDGCWITTAIQDCDHVYKLSRNQIVDRVRETF